MVQIGDLVWIQPIVIANRRRLQGKVGIVKRIVFYNNDHVCLIDFIDFGEDWVNASDLIVLSRTTQTKADLPAANFHLDKCPK
jgi:hypothetical protein